MHFSLALQRWLQRYSHRIAKVQKTNPELYQLLSVVYCGYEFLEYQVCYYFCSEEVLQGMAKNNPTEKQLDAEYQAALKHVPARKFTEEKT